MKRIALFLATNMAILIVLNLFLTILQNVFGIHLQENQQLFLFAAVIGMGGSLLSLALSKWMAKRTTGAHVISQPRNETEQWLYDVVKHQSRQARIGMPEVAIYQSNSPNAFATGMSRNNALVAVSTGLLQHMNRDEVEAVLGHEVSHVANGDMVTLTLIQGVVNTFVIFLAHLIGRFVDQAISGNRGHSGFGLGYYAVVIVAEIILGFLASIIVMWFSRFREYRADAGGAQLASSGKMIAALKRLKSISEGEPDLPKEFAAFGLFGGKGLSRLFMSHPPLEERIARLERGRR